MSEEEQLQLLATNGMLVKRPLVVGEDFVLTGFREKEWEEKLEKILSSIEGAGSVDVIVQIDEEKRIEYELSVIDKMGFNAYFLIVSDFVSYAKRSGIPVGPGRGSGAASIVAYCMHITEVDPMKYALIFERFLNPERVSMPDFDTDFCQERRGEVIDYVMRKYGSDHVAQIATFGTMAARGAIRDVGRALNFTYAETDVVAKLVPTTLHITLKEALEVSPQLKEKYDSDERVKTLIDTAMSLEGMPRNTSTHAAGVVITADPVCTYVPLSRNDDTIVTQYTMTTIEELGLLKMDFPGLRNLTVIEDAQKQIRLMDPDFDINKVPDDDPETFRMLAEGKGDAVVSAERRSARTEKITVTVKFKTFLIHIDRTVGGFKRNNVGVSLEDYAGSVLVTCGCRFSDNNVVASVADNFKVTRLCKINKIITYLFCVSTSVRNF